MEARTNEGLEADALLEDVSFFQEDLDGGASSSKTPKLSQQAPGSLLIGGYRKGHKFTSSFATRRVKKGDIGLVVEQVSLYDAPFLRVDFGTNKGVVDFNSMCCEPAEDQRGGDATVPANNARSNCVLGFKHLKVKQPEFYRKIHELVKSNVLW